MDYYGCDVTHYLLDIQIFPVTETVAGYVAITAVSGEASLQNIDVDLVDNMSVSQVLRDGSALSFT